MICPNCHVAYMLCHPDTNKADNWLKCNTCGYCTEKNEAPKIDQCKLYSINKSRIVCDARKMYKINRLYSEHVFKTSPEYFHKMVGKVEFSSDASESELEFYKKLKEM